MSPPDKMLGEVQQHLWNLSYQESQPESNQAIDQTFSLQEMKCKNRGRSSIIWRNMETNPECRNSLQVTSKILCHAIKKIGRESLFHIAILMPLSSVMLPSLTYLQGRERECAGSCRMAFDRPPLKVVYISFHLHFFGHNFIRPLPNWRVLGNAAGSLGKRGMVFGEHLASLITHVTPFTLH